MGTTQGFEAQCQMDTMADTTCAGANFRLLETTGQTCEVSGFHSAMTAIEDVPVATCATAYTDEDGQTFILIFHQALYFGRGMDNSLINPNQIRPLGIPVSDDPYDGDRAFGIVHTDLYIPFKTEGTKVHFVSRVPTDTITRCPMREIIYGV